MIYVTDESSRMEAATRLRAIRTELASIESRIAAFDPRDPNARVIAASIVGARGSLDMEQAEIEKELRAYRDPRVTSFLREVRNYIQTEGPKHALRDLSGKGSGSVNNYEVAIQFAQLRGENGAIKPLQDAIKAHLLWEREGYEALERLQSRVAAGIFRDEPLEPVLHSAAREFEGIRAKFRKGFIESFLESEAR